jgi:opacity protein-like surface antigen
MPYFGVANPRENRHMTARRASVKLLGAIAAMALLAVAVPPAAAQTIANPEKKKVATAKPAAKSKPAQARLSDQTSTDYWAVNTDLGKYSRDIPTERTMASRVPLRDAPGTVGFTSGVIRNGTLADGSTAGGMERYNQEQKSYVGMSLSVTSKDKNFPIPLLQRNTDW